MIPPPQALRAFPPRGAPVADRRSRIRAAWLWGTLPRMSAMGVRGAGGGSGTPEADPRGRIRWCGSGRCVDTPPLSDGGSYTPSFCIRY